MFNHQSMFTTFTTFNDRLSVTTNYYIRKLIRRYSGRLTSVITNAIILETSTQSSIDKILESLYLEPDHLVSLVNELELMVAYHQQIEKKLPYTSTQKLSNTNAQLQELEQQIFRAIGFQVRETAASTFVDRVSVKPNPQLQLAA
jgi:hypothetical protein